MNVAPNAPGARETIHAEDVASPIGPYAHAVRHDHILYCTGQLPLDPESGELGGTSIVDQARLCLENLERVCRAADTALANAARVGIYAVDLSAFREINAVYRQFFPDEPPARTMIGVASLPMGAEIEMDAIVIIPEG